MPISLLRIDDRLLHGQVTHGWGPALDPELVVIADDRAARDEWERECYEASGPEGAQVRVVDLSGCVAAYREGTFEAPRTLILVRGPVELRNLLERGLDVREANVGGLHAGPGRVRVEDDLQIGPEEATAFSALERAGVTCYYQPLPGDPRRELPDLSKR